MVSVMPHPPGFPPSLWPYPLSLLHRLTWSWTLPPAPTSEEPSSVLPKDLYTYCSSWDSLSSHLLMSNSSPFSFFSCAHVHVLGHARSFIHALCFPTPVLPTCAHPVFCSMMAKFCFSLPSYNAMFIRETFLQSPQSFKNSDQFWYCSLHIYLLVLLCMYSYVCLPHYETVNSSKARILSST